VRSNPAPAILSVLVHGLVGGLMLARAAPHVDAVVAPATEAVEVTRSEEAPEVPVDEEPRVAEVDRERAGAGTVGAPAVRSRSERPDDESPSEDPRLVKGKHISALSTRAGEDLPDPAAAVAAIDGVVRAQMRRFRTCHGAGLPGSIGVGGDVSVRLLLATHGSVLDVRPAGDSFPDEAVRRCVVRAFTQMQFPPPPGGAAETVTYTLSLVAGDVVRAPDETLDPRRGE
jgi:hypothetical protein